MSLEANAILRHVFLVATFNNRRYYKTLQRFCVALLSGTEGGTTAGARSISLPSLPFKDGGCAWIGNAYFTMLVPEARLLGRVLVGGPKVAAPCHAGRHATCCEV